MTPEEFSRLRGLAVEIGRKSATLLDVIAEAEAEPAEETPQRGGLPLAPALVAIGSAGAQPGKEAVVAVRVTCPEPLAGIWLNLRHSPKLEFLSAKSKVKSKAFRVEKGENHFRALVMFSTDLETGSAAPGTGTVQLDPETLVLECTYRVQADAAAGQRYVVQAGRSGASGAGTSGPSVSWPTLLLNWGSGGITPAVEDGYVEVIA